MCGRGERGERRWRLQRAPERRALHQRLAPGEREHAGEVSRARRRERFARGRCLLRQRGQSRVETRQSAVHVHEAFGSLKAFGAYQVRERLAPRQRERARDPAAPARRPEPLARRRQRRQRRFRRLQPAKQRRERQRSPGVSARAPRRSFRAFQVAHVRVIVRVVFVVAGVEPRARVFGDGGEEQRRSRGRRAPRAVRQSRRQLRSRTGSGERGDSTGRASDQRRETGVVPGGGAVPRRRAHQTTRRRRVFLNLIQEERGDVRVEPPPSARAVHRGARVRRRVPAQHARARRRVAERQRDVVVVGGGVGGGARFLRPREIFKEIFVPREGRALRRPRRARGPRREPRAQRLHRHVEGVVPERRGWRGRRR